MAKAAAVMRGNHDHAVAHDDDSRWSLRYRAVAEATRRYTSSVLSGTQKEFLRGLPLQARVERDGTAFHLAHARPSDQATNGGTVDLSVCCGRTVVYIYPRTGRPGVPNPGGWDMIPGARGCSPQSCAFRDHFAELKRLGVDRLYGLSTQDTAYQRKLLTACTCPSRCYRTSGSSSPVPCACRPSKLTGWRCSSAARWSRTTAA